MVDDLHSHFYKPDLSQNILFVWFGLLCDQAFKLNHLSQVAKPMAYFDKIREGVFNIDKFLLLIENLRASAKHHNRVYFT